MAIEINGATNEKSSFQKEIQRPEADVIKAKIDKQFAGWPDEITGAAKAEAMRLLSDAKEFEGAQQKARQAALDALNNHAFSEAQQAASVSNFFMEQAGLSRRGISELGGGTSQPNAQNSYEFLISSLRRQPTRAGGQ